MMEKMSSSGMSIGGGTKAESDKVLGQTACKTMTSGPVVRHLHNGSKFAWLVQMKCCLAVRFAFAVLRQLIPSCWNTP